jgi:hypothetical protein
MSNTFKTELIWNVYDGTNEPTEGKTYLVLTSELPLIKCEYCCGKWERYRKLVSCLKLGDMFALFPDVNQFPKFNVIISLEGDLPMADTDCAPNLLKQGDIVKFLTVRETLTKYSRWYIGIFVGFYSNYTVINHVVNEHELFLDNTQLQMFEHIKINPKLGYFSNIDELYLAPKRTAEIYTEELKKMAR